MVKNTEREALICAIQSEPVELIAKWRALELVRATLSQQEAGQEPVASDHTMTEAEAIELGRKHAAQNKENRSYCDEALCDRSWKPHRWVIDAILEASGVPVPGVVLTVPAAIESEGFATDMATEPVALTYLIRARWPDGIETYLDVKGVHDLGDKIGIDVDAPEGHPLDESPNTLAVLKQAGATLRLARDNWKSTRELHQTCIVSEIEPVLAAINKLIGEKA